MAEPLVWLADVLRDADLRVKEHDGWKERAAEGDKPEPVGVLEHHTAVRTSDDDPAPSIDVCIKGRSDLPGPICHALIGYDGTIHVIAAGRANHAGDAKKSGPVPAGNGNDLYVGFEWDYQGVEQKPSRKQYQAAVRATAAVLKKLDRPADAARAHKETSVTGKIDPGHVDMDEFRDDVAAALKKLSGERPPDEEKPKDKKLPKAGDGPRPRKKMGPPDPDVYHTIYLVGKELKVSDKVMLAAFETGLVESHMSNLNWGDEDSVGAFQQRPSMGWGSKEECMNVNHAAHEFFERAVKVDKQKRDITAGQLAQAVQRSAYPDRYDEREDKARKLIEETEKHYGVDGDDKEDKGKDDKNESQERDGDRQRPGERRERPEPETERPEDKRDRRDEERSQDKPESPGDADGRDRHRPGQDDGDRKDEPDKGKLVAFSSWIIPGKDGALSAFARSTRGDLVTAWQVGPQDDWVGWLDLGGDSEGMPVVARDHRGAVSVFARREDGQIETSTHSEPGKWSKWRSIPEKMASEPAVLVLRNGAMMLFAVGKDGKLYTVSQAGSNGHWSRWRAVGGKLTGRPTVVPGRDGEVMVFARNADDAVCMTKKRTAGADWSGWTVLGGSMAAAPIAAKTRNGDLLLIAVGNDGALYTTTKIEKDADWESAGGNLVGIPAVATSEDGEVSVFARDEQGEVWTARRDRDGAWSEWKQLEGRMAGDPVAVTGPEGEVSVFAIGRNGDMYTTNRNRSGDGWKPWREVVDSLRA